MLALAAAAFAGFWPGPGRVHKVLTGLAVALPLLGIAVLLATSLSVRSGLMGGGLVMSSDCGARSSEAFENGKLVSRTAAVVVVAIWTGVALLCFAWVSRVLLRWW